LRLEPIIDDISEQIVVNLQNNSDNISCSSSEEEEEDDGEESGIEALQNVHQPLEVIQSALMFLCLVVERKPFPCMRHYHQQTELLPALSRISQLMSYRTRYTQVSALHLV
jgi:hypothetical protein